MVMRRFKVMILFAAGTLLVLAAAMFVVNRAHRSKGSQAPLLGQTATSSAPTPVTDQPLPHPGVKRIYLGHPVGKTPDGLEEQVSMVVFYEDGQWGRITPMINRTGRNLKVRCEELCTAERGSWHDDGYGSVLFVSNTFVCPICPFLREDVTRRPIEELWHYDRGNLRNSRGRVIGEVETYELLDISRLANYQSVYLPFDLKDSGIID
jgi:hypothetical protein